MTLTSAGGRHRAARSHRPGSSVAWSLELLQGIADAVERQTLAYLGVATFASVRQSIRAVETRRRPEALRTPFHLALAWLSVGGSVAVIGYALAFWSEVSPILLALSPVGLFTERRMLDLMRHPGADRMGWFYSHMGSMLGGGIAFHTAFAVFGAQRVWDYTLSGNLAIVPWILPSLVGLPGIVLGTMYHRRKFARAG